MEIKDYQKSLLSLCAHALFGESLFEPDINEDVTWEADKQTVLSLIIGNLEENSEAKIRALNIAAKNMLIKNEHIKLDKIMDEAAIPYVILKGCASAAYYPEPILRTMGDIDILVSPSDIIRSDAALRSIGFFTEETLEGDRMHILYRHNNGLVCELHRGINGIPKTELGEVIKKYLVDIFEKSVKSADGFVVPSHFHHGLIILLHMVSHLITDGFGLRHLCDWAAFVSHFSDAEFCDMFETPLKKFGLWKAAQLMTACSVKYLNCPEKTFAKGIDDDLIDALMCDVFTGGNFGRKQIGRNQQIKFISNRNDNTVDDKSVFRQLLNTFNYKAKNRYKFIQKYPVLLPIGWITVAADYIGSLIKGKRSTKNFKSNIETAKLRKSIYNKIELFEINQ